MNPYENLGDQMGRVSLSGNEVMDKAAVAVCDKIYGDLKSGINTKPACDTYSILRFQIGFQSLTTPSSNTLQIPNANICDSIWVRLQLPAIAANVSAVRGWGYAAINRIKLVLV